MRRQAKGQIHERITAIPNAWHPIYLVRGEKKNLVIDAGVNLLGPRYREMIREILGDHQSPHYLFLTHSHYDHIGAAGYLKELFPGLKIGAHPRLAGLLQKQSVLDMMNRLSQNHIELHKYNPAGEDLTLRPFGIDIELKQKDRFDLGGLTCCVYETPGHTKDSLSFYFPEIQTLFPGESAGVPQGRTGSEIQVEFLSSYQDYIDSLQWMVSLRPEIICLGHGWMVSGKEAEGFLRGSLAATYRYRELIEHYLSSAGGNAQRATEEMAHAEYDVKGGIFQEKIAYMTNLNAQVRHIAGLSGS
jgi:glyoxylase-like metal-dependent hydrolase (beta-lactamase superfamily II)